MRVGILGGVFNPPHLGHLVCAQEALVQLRLESVAFMPVREAPHRAVEDDPGPELRAELCERAVAGDPRFSVSRLEVEREGPSYTVDTLRQLGGSARASYVLIMGADRAASLPRWREPEAVLRLAVLAVAEREEMRRAEVKETVGGLAGADRVGFFDMPRIDVSSTLVRQRARVGQPIRYLVPDAVLELIEERGLYRSGAAAGA